MSAAIELYQSLSCDFCVDASKPMAPRPMQTHEGVGDRLRAAAFAEVQAQAAFLWAAEKFVDAPEAVHNAWLELAAEEAKHLGWLKARAVELGVDLRERPVSDRLWHCLIASIEPGEFCHVMARAETAGKTAGERFEKGLATFDPVSAAMFGKIAEEETRHIELAWSFYPAPMMRDARADRLPGATSAPNPAFLLLEECGKSGVNYSS